MIEHSDMSSRRHSRRRSSRNLHNNNSRDKDPDLVGRIQDRLFIPDNCRRALVSDRCQVCETHVGQLKQEVVSMVQSFERAQSQDAASSAPGGSSTSASAPAPVARTAKVPTVLRLPSSGTPSGHH
ncbi:uncharacterized protein LOC112041608, partial [Lingula anatina]|uniref:Uncharacterized protein LOC112041608 n=1 Tax=Lingula anatina TaxID=7574 RepID=A0A2R2ML65_LINAN